VGRQKRGMVASAVHKWNLRFCRSAAHEKGGEGLAAWGKKGGKACFRGTRGNSKSKEKKIPVKSQQKNRPKGAGEGIVGFSIRRKMNDPPERGKAWLERGSGGRSVGRPPSTGEKKRGFGWGKERVTIAKASEFFGEDAGQKGGGTDEATTKRRGGLKRGRLKGASWRA